MTRDRNNGALQDWLAFGQMKSGRRYKQGIALTGLDYQTLRNYALVARRFELSRRRDNLSFQHHAEVCALSVDGQDYWLDLAAKNRWSKSELRRRIRAAAARSMHGTPATAIRLVLESPRERRWLEAAERSGCPLDHWIVQVLDEAASAVLQGAPHAISRR
jgi:hypothetical protein